MVLLNEDTGGFEPLSDWRMSCVAAGAVLMDLALANRIDTDLESLILLDETPLDDDLLDPSLAEIAAEPDTNRPIQYWVERIGVHAEDLVHKSSRTFGVSRHHTLRRRRFLGTNFESSSR